MQFLRLLLCPQCWPSPVFALWGQDVGSDVIGGAGIFRPKNPEAKKRTARTTTTTRRGTAPSNDGNERSNAKTRLKICWTRETSFATRDGTLRRRIPTRASSKLTPRMVAPHTASAIFIPISNAGRRRKLLYRNAALWSPANVDALVALSVALVQPRTGGDNASRFADAENFARRAVQLQPQNAVAWDRLGVALQSRGLFNNETEHAYRRAVELDPEFPVAYAHLARVLKRMGHADGRRRSTTRRRQLAKDPATLNLIAESLQAEQQWQNSEPVLKRALELDARNSTSLYFTWPDVRGVQAVSGVGALLEAGH